MIMLVHNIIFFLRLAQKLEITFTDEADLAVDQNTFDFGQAQVAMGEIKLCIIQQRLYTDINFAVFRN